MDFQLGGGRPNVSGVGTNQRDQKEIRIQVPARSGPEYSSLSAWLPSHLQKVCSLGSTNSTVEASRKRLAENAAGQGMEWDGIKAYVQGLAERGKLAKWVGSPESAQAELQKCWRYFNAANLEKAQ